MKLNELIEKNKPLTVWLLDLSWHLYRNYFVFQNITAGMGGKPTGHIYGLLQTVQQIRTLSPQSIIVICQDGFPKRRYELLEQSRGEVYKADRDELEYNFFNDISLIKGFLMPLDNVYWAYNPEEESDDIMFSLAKSVSDMVEDIIIYSGDDDLLQTVTDNIRVCRSHSKNSPMFISKYELQYSDKYLQKYFGFMGEKLIIFRSIIGDSSDKIKGIHRIPRKVVAQLVSQVNSIHEVFNQELQIRIRLSLTKANQKWLDAINENKDRILINYQLMKLPIIDVELEKVPVNIQAVKTNLQRLYLNAYLNYLESSCL